MNGKKIPARKRERGQRGPAKSSRRSLHEQRGQAPGDDRGGRFKPGNKLAVGHAVGRLAGKNSIAEILRELDDEILPAYTSQSGQYKNISRKQALHIAAYDEAIYNRQPWAVEYIAERTEGKVVQPMGLPDEVIHITYTDDPAPELDGE